MNVSKSIVSQFSTKKPLPLFCHLYIYPNLLGIEECKVWTPSSSTTSIEGSPGETSKEVVLDVCSCCSLPASPHTRAHEFRSSYHNVLSAPSIEMKRYSSRSLNRFIHRFQDADRVCMGCKCHCHQLGYKATGETGAASVPVAEAGVSLAPGSKSARLRSSE
jgi:hypothetical protein